MIADDKTGPGLCLLETIITEVSRTTAGKGNRSLTLETMNIVLTVARMIIAHETVISVMTETEINNMNFQTSASLADSKHSIIVNFQKHMTIIMQMTTS